MRAVAVPTADPRLEFHWIPDPGFLIQGFLIQCLHRSIAKGSNCTHRHGITVTSIATASP